MPHNLDLRIEHPIGGWFPADVKISQLEAVMQESFEKRSMVVVPEYFIRGSEYSPQNLLFMIFGRERTPSKDIGSGLITTQEIIDGIPIDYYCKIFVGEPHTGNGAMRDMIHMARQYRDGTQIPGLLRTSDPQLSRTYSKYSDTPPTEINGFHIHGFGFYDKATGKELFEGAAALFDKAAHKIAHKKRTVIPISSEVLSVSPAPAYQPTPIY